MNFTMLPSFVKSVTRILDENNAIYYRTVSVWEVSIKHTNHPDNVEFTGMELAQYCKEAGFLLVEMRDKHVFALETITRSKGAPPHYDPFDRMLIAQAKAENMLFLTHDSLLPYYEEKCIQSEPEGIEKLPRGRQFDQFIADQALSQISKPALEPFDEPICYAAFNNFYRIHMKPHILFPPFSIQYIFKSVKYLIFNSHLRKLLQTVPCVSSPFTHRSFSHRRPSVLSPYIYRYGTHKKMATPESTSSP